MSQPYVQVFVNFDVIDFSAGPLLLNDPVAGLLDTGTLASTDPTDLTFLVKSVSINRGRSRQLDQFTAGSAVVVFDNSSRALDPLNEDSPYYPSVLPRCGIQITANGIPIFYGLVVDWNLSYDITGQDVMTAVCSDDFTVLANQVFDAFTPSAELSGARINSVLARTEIDYQGTRQISAGTRQLGAYAVNAGTNVLNYLQLIAKSEQGALYTSAGGVLTFKDADDIPNNNPDWVFSDDGTGIPYQTLLNQYGDELLYNYIITESPAGGPFVASDVTSQVRYQYQQLALTDLLNSSSGVVEAIGESLLAKYKDPRLRLTGLSTQLVGQTPEQQAICLGLDLADLCQVTKTFTGGTPSSISQALSISGITHQITPESHVVSYTFEPLQTSVLGAASDEVVDGYRIVTWTGAGALILGDGSLDVEYLVVGGGGGGSRAGGGAGGLLANLSGSPLTITAGLYPVVVGSGGAGGLAGSGETNSQGSNGGNSSFGGLVAIGGGGGGGDTLSVASRVGRTGGSGGGGSTNGTSTTWAAGSGTSDQGNTGGTNGGFGANSPFPSGGGGGAGGAGGNATSSTVPGLGGAGVSNSITGSAVSYAGGGQAGLFNASFTGTGGGTGGGGNGRGNNANGIAGTDGLGGGGGGGGNGRNGGKGGNGVVIVRWPV
jgi:hypothetical protein